MFWLFRSRNYERQNYSSKVTLPLVKTEITCLEVVYYKLLVVFIRTDIVFKKLLSFEKAGMEILSICLKTAK